MLSPLDDAVLLYRASPYAPNLTQIISEGSWTNPLVLGDNFNTDARDLTYVQNEFGAWLHAIPGKNAFASVYVPPTVLNGDVWIALRYRPEQPFWVHDKLLLSMIDSTGLKHFMLTEAPGKYYLARFWDNTPAHAQIGIQSSALVDPNRTDTLIITWNSATKTMRLVINGVLQGEKVWTSPRSDVVNAPLSIAAAINGLELTGYLLPLALWKRLPTPQEEATLHLNADWNAGGAIPPPTEPGKLLVYLNGDLQTGASVKIDNEPVLPEGATDKIVEITTP